MEQKNPGQRITVSLVVGAAAYILMVANLGRTLGAPFFKEVAPVVLIHVAVILQIVELWRKGRNEPVPPSKVFALAFTVLASFIIDLGRMSIFAAR